MPTRFKKILYTTTILVISTSSLSVYPVGDQDSIQKEESSVGQSSNRLFVFPDNTLQEQDKPSAPASQNRATRFIKNYLSRVYNGIRSWTKHKDTKSGPLVTSLKGERSLGEWSDFREEVEDMKTSQPDRKRLKDLQDMVWKGIISPYAYEKGLKELEPYDSMGILKDVRAKFHKKLRSFPAALNGTFQKELLVFINHPCARDTRIEDTPYTLPSMQEFESILAYYRGIQNPVDYTETLVGLTQLLQKDGASLYLTDQQSMDLREAVSAAVHKIDQKQFHSLKTQQHGIQQIFQELPFHEEEIPESFNSPLPRAKKEAVQEGELSEPLSLRTAFNGLAHAVYKGTQYALKHPFQALTLGLAMQTATAVAQSSNEFQIDQGGSSQGFSPIATMNDNAFVVWGRMSASDISGRIYSSNGTALTNELYLNQNTAPIQVYPDIANINDNAFVVWGGFTNGKNIYGRLFSSSGTALTNDFDIYQNSVGYQRMPTVANISNNAFIVWYGSQTGDEDIYGRIVSPTGTPITTVFRINQNIAADQTYPDIANIDGKAFVVWMGNQAGSEDSYGRLFSPNGTALSNEFRINQNTTNFTRTWPPLTTALPNGKAFVSWSSNQAGSEDSYGRLFYPNGTALSNEFRINQNTTARQGSASIASLSNDNILASWSNEQSGNWDIYGRLFSPSGTALSNEFRINQNTTKEQHSPSIAIIKDKAFISWQGDQLGRWHVYGRIIDPLKFFTSTTSSSSDVSSTRPPTTEISPTSSTSEVTTASLSVPRSTNVSEETTSSSISHFTRLTSAISSTNTPTTEFQSIKKNPWKKIGIGAGVAGTSVVVLTVGGYVVKKYCLSKKGDKKTSDSTQTEDAVPLENIDSRNTATHPYSFLPSYEPIYGLTPDVRPTVDEDEHIYGFIPNLRQVISDERAYALTPNVSPAVSEDNHTHDLTSNVRPERAHTH